MNFAEFSASRKSARGFKDKAVSKETIDKIIEATKWAPSSYNTQTWYTHAVAGAVQDNIRKGNTENTLAGKSHVRDFPKRKTGKAFIDGDKLMWLFSCSKSWALNATANKSAWIGCCKAFASLMHPYP